MDTWSEVSASGIASRVTDSNGVAILDVGKLSSLGVGSGGYLADISVETADGNTDSTEMFFNSRRFAAFLQPVDAGSGTQCEFKQGFRKDENATFIIRGFNPAQGFNGGDINLTVPASGALTVRYFGSPTKPQFPPSVYENVNYDVNTRYPCRAMGGGQGQPQTQNLTHITMRKFADVNWESGFFEISLLVDANGGNFDGNREIAHGGMQTQSFSFRANPNEVGQFGPPIGKPGGVFDINTVVLGATGDVNITAAILDTQSGGKFEMGSGSTAVSDLNIGFWNPGTIGDCNAASCPNRKVQKTSDSNSQDVNVLAVLIPSNVKLQDYLIQLTATDSAGNSAQAEVYLTMKMFKLVNFGWFQNLYGQFGVQNTPLAPLDWNTTGKTVQGVYQSFGGPGGGGAPMLDYNFIVDYTNRRLVPDRNHDRNFGFQADLNVGQDLNNMYRITDISRVGAEEPGIKFIRTSALSTTESTFGYIGTYPADTNFTIPIMIKDVNGSGIDANVVVTNVSFFNPGSFFSINLSTNSCSTLA
ncbi:MAG: hypothetical protein Q7R47_01350, partial [Candidatus Diapherotrites archaeon]|nr:hypothetical protein [Candidatus Diapherotrites archaeon]